MFELHIKAIPWYRWHTRKQPSWNELKLVCETQMLASRQSGKQKGPSSPPKFTGGTRVKTTSKSTSPFFSLIEEESIKPIADHQSSIFGRK